MNIKMKKLPLYAFMAGARSVEKGAHELGLAVGGGGGAINVIRLSQGTCTREKRTGWKWGRKMHLRGTSRVNGVAKPCRGRRCEKY